MSKRMEALVEALEQLDQISGLACEDCGKTLRKGEVRATPLASGGGGPISRIDILCEPCLRERVEEPERH